MTPFMGPLFSYLFLCRVQELPRFQELIFEDFSRFILVENIFEEVVLHSVMKDIMMGESHSGNSGFVLNGTFTPFVLHYYGP